MSYTARMSAVVLTGRSAASNAPPAYRASPSSTVGGCWMLVAAASSRHRGHAGRPDGRQRNRDERRQRAHADSSAHAAGNVNAARLLPKGSTAARVFGAARSFRSATLRPSLKTVTGPSADTTNARTSGQSAVCRAAEACRVPLNVSTACSPVRSGRRMTFTASSRPRDRPAARRRDTAPGGARVARHPDREWKCRATRGGRRSRAPARRPHPR